MLSVCPVERGNRSRPWSHRRGVEPAPGHRSPQPRASSRTPRQRRAPRPCRCGAAATARLAPAKPSSGKTISVRGLLRWQRRSVAPRQRSRRPPNPARRPRLTPRARGPRRRHFVPLAYGSLREKPAPAQPRWHTFQPAQLDHFSTGLTRGNRAVRKLGSERSVAGGQRNQGGSTAWNSIR
jgi:hypothetical protein